MESYRDELYHYGVSGMKWGVWNDDTRAKRMGFGRRRRYGKVDKMVKKAVEARKSGDTKRADKYMKKAYRKADKFISKDAQRRKGIFSSKDNTNLGTRLTDRKTIVEGRRGMKYATAATILASPLAGIVVGAAHSRTIRDGIGVTRQYSNMLVKDIEQGYSKN